MERPRFTRLRIVVYRTRRPGSLALLLPWIGADVPLLIIRHFLVISCEFVFREWIPWIEWVAAEELGK